MRPTLRLAAVILVLIVEGTIDISGGGIKQHVSDIFPRMIQELPFNGQKPLAREARFTLYQRIYLNDKPQPATFATNEPGGAKAPMIVPAVLETTGSHELIQSGRAIELNTYKDSNPAAAVLANSAVADLYARIEETKQTVR